MGTPGVMPGKTDTIRVLVSLGIFAMSSPSTINQGTELAPNYSLALGLGVIGLICLGLQPLVTLGLWLFGLFLAYQSATLRLHFTYQALKVYLGSEQIRHFPYTEWQSWLILWPPVPILFYFREVKSIHLLPILFDPQALRTCLEQYCPPSSPV